jgi:hypothetical protein
MGAGVSKDTLKRYINNKCIQLNEHDDIHSETFEVVMTLIFQRILQILNLEQTKFVHQS